MLDQSLLRSGRDSARSARPVLNVTRASSPSSGAPSGSSAQVVVVGKHTGQINRQRRKRLGRCRPGEIGIAAGTPKGRPTGLQGIPARLQTMDGTP